MARLNVLSSIFFLMAFFGFLFSTHFALTGNSIQEEFITFGFWSFFTVLSFVMFLILFLSGKKLEAILVPTGSNEADRERARRGAEYYLAHREDDPEVLISGSVDGKYGRDFLTSQPGHIYKYMRRGKVPKGEFLFEPESKNTAENVVYSCDVVKKKGIRKLDVVSNPSHLWRFKFLFKKARDEGLIGEDVEINYVPTRRNVLFEDVSDALYGVAAYVKERAKWAGKSLRTIEGGHGKQ